MSSRLSPAATGSCGRSSGSSGPDGSRSGSSRPAADRSRATARRSSTLSGLSESLAEGMEQNNIVALDIPPEADLRAVKELLRTGEADGRWDYEEGCVTEAWLNF